MRRSGEVQYSNRPMPSARRISYWLASDRGRSRGSLCGSLTASDQMKASPESLATGCDAVIIAMPTAAWYVSRCRDGGEASIAAMDGEVGVPTASLSSLSLFPPSHPQPFCTSPESGDDGLSPTTISSPAAAHRSAACANKWSRRERGGGVPISTSKPAYPRPREFSQTALLPIAASLYRSSAAVHGANRSRRRRRSSGSGRATCLRRTSITWLYEKALSCSAASSC